MSLLFYISLIFLRLFGVYLCLNLITSIVIDALKKNKNQVARKLLLGKKLSLALLILLFLVAHIRQNFFQGYTDWHPEFTKETIVGKWKKGNREIVFEENSFFRKNFNNHISNKGQADFKYSWDLASSRSGIKIENERGEVFVVFRVIRFCNEFRLLEEYDDELVLTNLGYKKIKTIQK